jgi:hypothetical protein
MYQRRAGVTLDRAGREDLPPGLVPDRPHTHDALADAIEQAEIFVRLSGKGERYAVTPPSTTSTVPWA